MGGGQFDGLVLGDHALVLNPSRNLVRDFLKTAASRGSRAIFLVPQTEFGLFLRTVNRSAKFLPERREAVTLLPCEPFTEIIRSGQGQALRDRLKTIVTSARDDGWEGIWVFSRATGAMAEAGEGQAALEGERLIQRLVSELHFILLCSYGRSTHPQLLEAVGRQHGRTL